MAILFKACGSEIDKYSATRADNFDHKFMLFLERYDQMDILVEDRYRVSL